MSIRHVVNEQMLWICPHALHSTHLDDLDIVELSLGDILEVFKARLATQHIVLGGGQDPKDYLSVDGLLPLLK